MYLVNFMYRTIKKISVISETKNFVHIESNTGLRKIAKVREDHKVCETFELAKIVLVNNLQSRIIFHEECAKKLCNSVESISKMKQSDCI